jgi:predicted house-cleaning noncanonical NTP pyrophosphatase (MazG superfamily)
MSKLVRDKIPEIIKKANKIPETHIANNDEYWEKLKAKLTEEVGEFLEDSCKEELADILEVLNAIYEFKGFTKEQIEDLQLQVAQEKGEYTKKIVLDAVR